MQHVVSETTPDGIDIDDDDDDDIDAAADICNCWASIDGIGGGGEILCFRKCFTCASRVDGESIIIVASILLMTTVLKRGISW